MTQAYTHKFTEEYEMIGQMADLADPGVYPTVAYRSMANHQRGVVILILGGMAQGATVDLVLMQAQDAAGTGAKVIAGKAMTQLTQAAGDGGDIVAIELRTEELDVNNGFSFVGAILTIGVGAVEIAVVALMGASNYMPVPTTGWTEIVD